MSYYMISESDVRKEQFNQVIREKTKTLTWEQFCMYFGAILGLACEYGFISEAQKIKREKEILEVIQSYNNGVIIANVLYVFSLWLQNLTPVEALEKLAGDETNSTYTILQEADSWFKAEVKKVSGILNNLRKKIVELNNNPLTGSFFQLNETINALSGYNSNPKVNLKKLHMDYCVKHVKNSLDYTFLEEKSAVNYLELVRYLVKDFYTEICIICKLQGKDALNYMNEIYIKIAEADENAAMEIEEQFKARLEKAEADYKEKIKAALEFEQRFEALSVDEQKKISNEEFDKFDTVRIDNEYKQCVAQINEEWSQWEQKTEAENDKSENEIVFTEKDILWSQNSFPGLVYLSKEFALCYFAEQGVCGYPTDPFEKVRITDNISTLLAVWVMLEFSERLNLSEGERDFLRKYYNSNGGDEQKKKDFTLFTIDIM